MSNYSRAYHRVAAEMTAALASGTLLLVGCGDPSLGVTTETYEPRIVVEAVLMPGHPVGGVRITRNARVDEPLFNLTLRDAAVVLIDEQSGNRYELAFHDSLFDHDDAYRYEGDELTIEHGGTCGSILVTALSYTLWTPITPNSFRPSMRFKRRMATSTSRCSPSGVTVSVISAPPSQTQSISRSRGDGPVHTPSHRATALPCPQ
jgi:hypothetical protein